MDKAAQGTAIASSVLYGVGIGIVGWIQGDVAGTESKIGLWNTEVGSDTTSIDLDNFPDEDANKIRATRAFMILGLLFIVAGSCLTLAKNFIAGICSALSALFGLIGMAIWISFYQGDSVDDDQFDLGPGFALATVAWILAGVTAVLLFMSPKE
eukprot:TRINITY_DN10872_c1_g2_i2.p1 TRINITY_DN10872_c1_g2~~TRINITY_DN10872_c1_g2_i2.p1  ORF type:complete len:154 (+),score=37.25 TRINITY_DN10872_c1_g2_i2:819-1280(+)